MHLSRFPRLDIAHLPTPLEYLENISEELGGPSIFIKRDDCTGLATGGNKTRKLEFLLADALKNEADTVITQGATQSNHVRQTVAAACVAGLNCEVLLENRTGFDEVEYQRSGNVFLDQLMGVEPRHYPAGSDMNAEMERVAEEVRKDGGNPYVIPGGGSNAVGSLGYVDCALELMRQADDIGLRLDAVVHATGSRGTQAGLVAGFAGARTGIPTLGISIRTPKEAQEKGVHDLANEVTDHLGLGSVVTMDDVQVNDDYIGDGYGIPSEEMVHAVGMMARLEGILLDPVYTGKAFAGLLDLVQKGVFKDGQNVVFVHTGGSAGLFGYRDAFVSDDSASE